VRVGELGSDLYFAQKAIGLRGTNTLWRARIAALLGERDESIALLQRTFGEGLVYGIWMRCDTDLELLHGFPSFEELTRPTG